MIRRFVPAAALSLWLILIFGGPLLAPYDPMRTDAARALQAPNGHHLLGTDRLGRDVWSRFLHGGMRTVGVAVLATAVAVIPGLLMGLLAALRSGLVDMVLPAVINALLAFPSLALALVVVTLMGAGAGSIIVATGVALIASFARVTRAAVIEVGAASFVEAARAAGASPGWLIRRHILPNAGPTLLAMLGLVFSYSLMNSAALSFLGLGGDLGVPDWGTLIYEGRAAFRVAPWISLAPGAAIAGLVLTVNALVDRLNQLPGGR